MNPHRRGRRHVDWREVRRRLEAARAAIERVWAPAPEEAKRILKARAQALAREPEQAQAADDTSRSWNFSWPETYGFETRYVREVYPLENLTPLPCTPAFVLGIVNLRGEILSVIDIRKFSTCRKKG